MPDDQYVLFIPDKECSEPDPNNPTAKIVSQPKVATNFRAIEQWANRTPYVFRGVEATPFAKLTDGIATDLKVPVAGVTYDPLQSYDSSTGIFTSKVQAIYDFYVKLAFTANPEMSVFISVLTASSTGAFALDTTSSKHFHAAPAHISLDTNMDATILGVTLNVGDRAKITIQAFAALTTTTTDVTFRKFIRRHSSYPGSTQ